MSSDPMVKKRIVKRLRQLKKQGVKEVCATDFDDLFLQLDMSDVTRTQGKKAIGSLAFNPQNKRRITFSRTSLWHSRDHMMGDRPITVALRKKR